MRIDLNITETSECRHGIHIWPKNDAVIGRALREWGEFAESENILMARYLSPGDVALDVGANVGTTVLPMARRVGHEGHVIAFEPHPLVAHCLATMLILNNITNTRVLTAAAGAAMGAGFMDFDSQAQVANHGAAKIAAAGTMVPILTLDVLGLRRCALIKIDVEGYELFVLQGAKTLIETCAPVIYFEAKEGEGTKNCIALLMAQGYRLYWHFAKYFRSENFRASPNKLFSRAGDMNILAVPKSRAQPDDLPEINSPEDDWQGTYQEFFRSRGLPQP